MISRVLKILYHFTVYAVGILVMLAAVAVTLIRLVLPDIGIYRSEVEAWASRYMEFPVVFHSIDANWQGWVPELTLKDIDLMNKAGTQTITHFDQARIQIDPLATIMQRQFIPRSLAIAGFNLSVTRHEDGSMSVQDIEIQGGSGTNSASAGNSELAEWLFKQDEIEINNAEIIWVDLKYKQEEPIPLTNVSFKMRNDVDRFQVDGSANLPESFGKMMNFAFDSSGDLMTSTWSGDLYISAEDINPDNWYRNIRPLDFDLAGGTADIEVWMTWNEAKLEKIYGELQYDEFGAMVQNTRILNLKTLTATFQGNKTLNNGWHLDVRLQDLLTENGSWPETLLSISSDPGISPGQGRYSTRFDYLKLNDLKPILANLAVLPQPAREFLEQITVGGELFNGTINYDASRTLDQALNFDTEFRHLSTNFGENFPGISGLAGRVSGTPHHGSLSLLESRPSIAYPTQEDEGLEISDVGGTILWSKSDDTWKITAEEFRVDTPDGNARLVGSISKTQASPHFLDLVLNVGESNLEKISRYLPDTEQFKFKHWMEKAILGGKLNSASILVRGSVEDFPFDNKEGRFQLHADFSDASLEYSSQWPVVDRLFGEINMQGLTLSASIQNGSFYNAEIVNAEAVIPNVLDDNKTVSLSGNIKGDIKDLTLFIDHSPLTSHSTLGEIRNSMRSGNFGIDLDITLPLSQANNKPEVAGTVNFINTFVDSEKMKLKIDEINGLVSFNGDVVSSNLITGQYMKKPVTIQLAGSREDPENPYKVTITGAGDAEYLVDRMVEHVPAISKIQPLLLERMSGETDWQAELKYFRDIDNQDKKLVTISTDLKGLEIVMPEPLGKRVFASTPVKITTLLDENPVRDVSIRYRDDLISTLQLDMNAKDEKLQQVKVRIGEPVPSFQEDKKFQINGKVSTLNARDWIEFISDISDDNQNPHPVMEEIAIDLEIAYLDLFGHEYTDVMAIGSKTDRGWSFNIDDDQIMGDAYLSSSASGDKLLTLLLDRLYLDEGKVRIAHTSEVNPATLPILSVEVDEFVHRGRDMGRFSLQSSKIHNGISIDSVEFIKDDLTITGNGSWLEHGDSEHSKFNIQVHADEMNSMLSTLGYDLEAIKEGETNFQIIADWPGSPLDFELENLNGRLDIEVRNGTLLDVNPSAGRLFGLLSFHTLPRRLLLDFRDLFSKGMRFDSINGSFDIANGNAYTNNLTMDSPAADVAISGRTGLAEQDYDQIVTVTPQITETMPVAGAIFGPVGIGVGAVIYLVGEMFDSLDDENSALLQYQYSITGSWSDPVIKKLKDSEVIAGG